MAMELNEIETFVTIHRVGGFGRAVTILHISQPAISRRIDLLERELGAPLFERLSTGVRLTEVGQAFLPYAQQLLRHGLDEAPIIAIDSLTAQKRLIEADFGVGLLPASSIEEELRLGTVRLLPIAALQTTVPVVVIHLCQAYLSRAARRLLEMLTE